jgi:hypothetical protein
MTAEQIFRWIATMLLIAGALAMGLTCVLCSLVSTGVEKAIWCSGGGTILAMLAIFVLLFEKGGGQ